MRLDREERFSVRRNVFGHRKVVFGASRAARIWAALFLIVNIVLTILVWRGFQKL